MQGIKIINEKSNGKSTVQLKDINWSKRIIGKDARTHTKINTKIQDLIPKTKPLNNPSNIKLGN